MTDQTQTLNQESVLKFADAVLRIWGRHLELSAIVLDGHRARLKDQGSCEDPFVSSTSLQITLQQAIEGKSTPDTKEAKIEMVASLLHVWFRVRQPLQEQILQSVQELAVIHDEPLDAARLEAFDVIAEGRSVNDELALKRSAGLRQIEMRETVREQARLTRMSERLEREAVIGA